MKISMFFLISATMIALHAQSLRPKEPIEGKRLYMRYCARCHGVDARGITCPDISDSDYDDVADAISSVGAMAHLQPKLDKEKQQAIAAYLSAIVL